MQMSAVVRTELVISGQRVDSTPAVLQWPHDSATWYQNQPGKQDQVNWYYADVFGEWMIESACTCCCILPDEPSAGS